ncbi:MAG TPA: ABC transporter ATP-binding protein [Actinobacteria bacterium]|nr:ABC transporter ATP-binding protein [Actinomycetota bacterium]
MNTVTETAIHLTGLSKDFGDFRAVDGLTVDVPRGGVVGLLGPNGAGKSTTIRMLLGLIRPTAGTADVLGASIKRPAEYMRAVGALIEAPAFYPKLSGKDNLRSLAALEGTPRSRVGEVLDIVGLTGRESDRAADYSLGMKQRLAIASALLRDPELLILDEPTNGLDPAGIVEIRNLLRRLGDEGKTVFVSSHLLAEIEAACDRLVVMKRGRLVFDGETKDLLAQGRDETIVEPEHPENTKRLVEILTSVGIAGEVDGPAVRIAGTTHATPDINRLAFANDITLREIRIEREDLEDIFLRITHETEPNL